MDLSASRATGNQILDVTSLFRRSPKIKKCSEADRGSSKSDTYPHFEDHEESRPLKWTLERSKGGLESH